MEVVEISISLVLVTLCFRLSLSAADDIWHVGS